MRCGGVGWPILVLSRLESPAGARSCGWGSGGRAAGARQVGWDSLRAGESERGRGDPAAPHWPSHTPALAFTWAVAMPGDHSLSRQRVQPSRALRFLAVRGQNWRGAA